MAEKLSEEELGVNLARLKLVNNTVCLALTGHILALDAEAAALRAENERLAKDLSQAANDFQELADKTSNPIWKSRYLTLKTWMERIQNP